MVLALVLCGWWLLPPGALSLTSVLAYQQHFTLLAQHAPWQTAGVFFAVYILATALSFPGATVLTLLAGAQFGLLWGTLLISFASTAGATLAMLTSRYLLRDLVQRRFSTRLARVNRGIARDGSYYLFALRLMPLFPFFLVNLLMGLTPLSLWRYWWVSQLGMLPATVIYLNAGHQLSQIHRLQDIVSPGMLLALILIGLLPLAVRVIRPALAKRFTHRSPR
nr:TVP38/TMEM64 family protein [Shimwellia pseudoproteus]